MPQPNLPPAVRNASSLLEITLFTGMVGAIAIVGFVVMGDYDWLSAAFIGGAIGLLAGVVLAILLRRPSPAPRAKPIGRAPRATDDSERVVPGKSAEDRPNTTLQSRGLGSIPDAGGVGRPATPEARSPLDPAEIPISGAGGPAQPTTVAEASEAAAGGSTTTTGDPRPSGDDPGGSGGAVAYDPATAPSKPLTKPASARGAPEDVGEADEPASPGVEPVKPEMRDAPREEGPDDLTRIRGIGPALEQMLHRMGVYHFDQIASWGPAEVAWADENLEDFKGRVTRDDWVGQANEIEAEKQSEGS